MKSTGIVRKVDELGRIVLPIEMRRTLDIEEKDALEIYVEGESVILRKYQASCVFCDSVKERYHRFQRKERLHGLHQQAQSEALRRVWRNA